MKILTYNILNFDAWALNKQLKVNFTCYTFIKLQ